MTIFRERNITIRKERPCIWCHEPLTKGSHAVDIFCKVPDYDVTTGAMHPECKAEGWDQEDWDSIDYLFYGGEYERGCCCEKGGCQCRGGQQ